MISTGIGQNTDAIKTLLDFSVLQSTQLMIKVLNKIILIIVLNLSTIYRNENILEIKLMIPIYIIKYCTRDGVKMMLI